MNAMAINLTDILDKLSDKKSGKINLEIIDPYNGLKDIKNRQLRAVDDKLFLEDPLRFFRVMQFISRFEFNPHPSLDKLCSNMSLYDVSTNTPLAKERIYEELKKLFLKSRVPSLGFRWLLNINRLREIFPELFSLVGVLQQKKYHPEGDVFEHTMQSIDAGAQLNYFESEEEKLLILYSLLCHDLGKAISTDKDLKCHGHEKKGVSLAQKLMKRLTNDKKFYKPVEKLVLYHRLPIDLLEQNATDKAYKRLAIKLASEVNLRQLGLVSLADLQGRNKSGHEPLISLYHDKFNLFLNKARESFVEKYPEEPVLKGRHLLNICPAGPKMGKLLKRAYNIQIEEGIKDLEELKKQVLKDFKKSIK
jgi:tRNA nucleotidyltransferase (CCA-adding enzyme)